MIDKLRACKFLKKIVIFCISFLVVYTLAITVLSFSMKEEVSPTLTTCVFATFGGELLVSGVIKIFETIVKPEESTDSESIE